MRFGWIWRFGKKGTYQKGITSSVGCTHGFEQRFHFQFSSLWTCVFEGQEDFLRVRKKEKKWGTFAWMQPSRACDPFFTPRSRLTDSCYFVPHQKLTFVSFLSLIQDSGRYKVVKNGKRWSKNSQCSHKLEKNECWGSKLSKIVEIVKIIKIVKIWWKR